MDDKIYTVELLHQGKYESWGFDDAVTRNNFFYKVKEQFAGKEIRQKDESVDDMSVVQLSASSLRVTEDGKVSQIVPYEWYEGKLFRDILNFMNEEYRKVK